jgi:hypothetical protein
VKDAFGVSKMITPKGKQILAAIKKPSPLNTRLTLKRLDATRKKSNSIKNYSDKRPKGFK